MLTSCRVFPRLSIVLFTAMLCLTDAKQMGNEWQQQPQQWQQMPQHLIVLQETSAVASDSPCMPDVWCALLCCASADAQQRATLLQQQLEEARQQLVKTQQELADAHGQLAQTRAAEAALLPEKTRLQR